MSHDPYLERPEQSVASQRHARGERAVATLGRFLADDGWRPRPAGPGRFVMSYRRESGGFELWAELIVASEQLVVSAIAPLTAPAARRAAAAEYLARAGWGLYVGGFDLNMDTGEVRARCGLDFEGEPLSPRLIRNTLTITVRLMETYLPGLARVCDGVAPLDAIRAIEHLGGQAT